MGLRIYQDESEKLKTLLHILKEYSVRDGKEYASENAAYIGDNLNNFEIMNDIRKKNGIMVRPADVAKKIKEIAKYNCAQNGGMEQ